MRARYLCIVLSISQVSPALAQLSTDHSLPGADVIAPAERSTPDFNDDFWDRLQHSGPPRSQSAPAPAPAPSMPQPTAEMLQEAQKKLTFFQRASLKIEFLLGLLAFLFPAERAIIGAAIALYNIISTSDENKSRAEFLRLFESYCRGCNVSRVRDMLLNDHRRVSEIVARGEQNLENMLDVSIPPNLMSLMRNVKSYSIINNCGGTVGYSMMYLAVDGSWQTDQHLHAIFPGTKTRETAFSYLKRYGLVVIKDFRVIVGREGSGAGYMKGSIQGKTIGFELRDARRDELGDWVIKLCG